jgi:hypothetical protein
VSELQVIIGGTRPDRAADPGRPLTDVSLSITLDDLAWWSRILERGRSEGELQPGTFRLFAARQMATGD